MTDAELRDLNARVARDVFGLTCWVHEGSGILVHEVESPAFPGRGAKKMLVPVDDYAGNMACAWLVVEKLTEQEYVKVSCSQSHYHGDYCSIIAPDETQMGDNPLVKRPVISVWGETMPQAICNAALWAVEVGT